MDKESWVSDYHLINDDIKPVYYQPPTPYKLDLEVMHSTTLRKKLLQKTPNTIERLNFYMLLLFTEGGCRHMIDFEWIDCQSGTLLILQPGQVHQFDLSQHWQSHVVIFHEDFLTPEGSYSALELDYSIQRLPSHLSLNQKDLTCTSQVIEQIFSDSNIQANSHTLHLLLQKQLQALIIRLCILHTNVPEPKLENKNEAKLHKQFQIEVEKNFHRQLRISNYAEMIGCSEKSLYRAVNLYTQVSPKKYLSHRVALEAKRLLAHTNQRVSLIAHQLGFDEPTNFSKFFTREVGLTPGKFREKYHLR